LVWQANVERRRRREANEVVKVTSQAMVCLPTPVKRRLSTIAFSARIVVCVRYVLLPVRVRFVGYRSRAGSVKCAKKWALPAWGAVRQNECPGRVCHALVEEECRIRNRGPGANGNVWGTHGNVQQTRRLNET